MPDCQSGFREQKNLPGGVAVHCFHRNRDKMKSSKVSRLSIQFQDVPTEKCVPVPVKVQ